MLSICSYNLLTKFGRNILLCIVAAVILSSCAAQQSFREGKELAASGKLEQAMDKFQQASTADSKNAEYRFAFLELRDKVLSTYLQRAEKLKVTGKSQEAEQALENVLRIDPLNERAIAKLDELKSGQRQWQLTNEAQLAFGNNDLETARNKLHIVLTENPNNIAAQSLQRKIIEKNKSTASDLGLSGKFKKPISIEFRDVSLKQLFEVISHSSGMNFVFDKEVKTDQKTSIFLKDSTIESAVHFVLMTNQLEQQIVDANTILIYPNTPAKVKDYQEMVVRTFFLANVDAKSIANTVKTIVKTKDIVIDEKLNMLILRDSPDAIRVAERLISLQDIPEPEVMLEVEVLEIKRTRLLALGIQWPDSLSLTPLPSTVGGSVSLRNLRNLNTGSIGATVSPMTVNAKKQDSDANLLANPRIRARNHENAKILIGERVPNITTTSTATGFVSESITYLEVGLKLNVQPTVYLDNDVAIKVDMEVSNIVGQTQTKSGSTAYQIGTRNASTVLRLKDGETQILAGLINNEDRTSANKVPGLGELPILGRLFGGNTDDNQKTEIILSITPRIVRNIQRPEASLSEFQAGTDSSFRNRPDSNNSSAANAASPLNTNDASKKSGTSPENANKSQATSQPNNGMPNVQGQFLNQVNTGTNTNPQYPNIGIVSSNPPKLQWQGPGNIKVGDNFSVQLNIQSDQGILNIPLTITYDSKLLQVNDVIEGDFLKQGNAQTTFMSRIDQNGQIIVSDTRNGDVGAVTQGTLLSVNFKALGSSDNSTIQVSNVSATGFGGRVIPVPVPTALNLKIQQ
ncbi:general secretion pathway protein GspD [Undibacterium sp. CY7W]|uniref:General secretion pathway protein GspD n=1 Tax=Undibacterium rugosum TaxID=2762291 RepID=A0A923I8S5_9BURK|nr:cohesin domain-containing protein [Undibacterium rugosum]MBC3935638.1 general secretion pathway protein GspD [Undibacterium rugosum]